ncbi:MAG: hypothetical protein M1602_06625, partial [Firmicutes bacterium]|nr:hypothetical protein [Bacillota bacterium]
MTVQWSAKEQPLRRDVSFLGALLGRILLEQEGQEFFNLEERVRELCKTLRVRGGGIAAKEGERRSGLERAELELEGILHGL